MTPPSGTEDIPLFFKILEMCDMSTDDDRNRTPLLANLKDFFKEESGRGTHAKINSDNYVEKCENLKSVIDDIIKIIYEVFRSY